MMGSAEILLTGSSQSLKLLQPLLSGCAHERLAVICLDADKKVLVTGLYDSLHRSVLTMPIREIVGMACAHNAAALVVAHNHPGGDPEPSREDIETTRRLAAALRPLDIRLFDHLIIAAGERWSSFRESGLL